jgi:hypothetical protein
MSHTQSLPPLSLLRRTCAPFGLFLTLLSAHVPLHAAVAVTPNPVVVADAWVGSAAPNASNNGNVLTARNDKDIYLRFELPVRGLKVMIDEDTNTINDGVLTAPPLTVKLRLWKTYGDPSTFSVYAADNGNTSGTLWDEASVNWNTRPRVDDKYAGEGSADVDPALVTNQPVGSGAGWVEFVLTDPSYISGAGEYTFCLKTSSTADIFFSSKEDIHPPELHLELPSDNIGSNLEFRRVASSVILQGERYIDRYIELNGGLGTPEGEAARDEVVKIGYFDVTKAPYHAKAIGNGSIDSTLAIQRCINEARDARVAVYFPPTNSSNEAYLISDTIECVQGLVKLGSSVITDMEVWNHRDFSCILMGPSVLPPGKFRPRLQIKGDSTAFNADATTDSTAIPMLRFWARSGSAPTTNQPAASYNHLVRYLDINLGGKKGAVGIDMDGAQGTAIEKLIITANGAYAGLSGMPGPGGSTTDVTIRGGKYGVTAYAPNSSAYTVLLTHCTLLDDTNPLHQQNSVRWAGLGSMVLVGCKIQGKGIIINGSGKPVDPENPTAPGEPGELGTNWRGNMSIVDSTIELTGPGGAAVTGSRSLYLRNVYLKNVTPIANITTSTGAGGSVNRPGKIGASAWFRVPEYYEGAHRDQYTGDENARYPGDPVTIRYPDDGIPEEFTPSFINPTSSTVVGLPTAAPGLPTTAVAFSADDQTAFLARHAMPDVPMWTGPSIINVKTRTGAKALGNNEGDDAPAIQNAINAALSGQAVFIPRGEYRLKTTLMLKADTVLFGLHKNLSRLKASEDTGSLFMTGGERPLVQSPNDAGATTRLADLMLLQRMSTPAAYLLKWQSGAGSVVQNVNFDRRIVGSGVPLNFPLVLITANGGGRWYNFQHQSDAHQNENVGSAYRNLLITGPTPPTKPTPAPALKFYMFNPETNSNNINNVEIKNRSNIDVYQSKFEGRKSPSVRISDSSDIRWIGVGGNAYTEAGEVVMSVVDCKDFLISSFSNQANYLDNCVTVGGVETCDLATDPLLFNRFKETLSNPPFGTDSSITLPGQKQAVVYRRGVPNDSN